MSPMRFRSLTKKDGWLLAGGFFNLSSYTYRPTLGYHDGCVLLLRSATAFAAHDDGHAGMLMLESS